MPFDRAQYSKPLPQDANPLTQDDYPTPPINGLYCDQQDCAIDWQRPGGGLDHYSDASKHPGFAAVQSKIAAKEGISKDRAGAILAASSRGASKAAKKANPALRKVKG